MSNKLSDYGHAFQLKLIASLFIDKPFLQQVAEILNPKYFESESNQFVVENVLQYFREYKDTPTLDVLKVKLQDEQNESFKLTVVDNLKQIYKYLDSNDLQFVKDETLKFCQNQCVKAAIVESVDIVTGPSPDYGMVRSKIDDALKAGQSQEIGHEWNEDVDSRYEISCRDTVPTGWQAIDDLMDGGLGAGELGVFVAPAGIGKSWALVNVGSNAAKKGLNVVHYTLELNEAYVGLRYDSVTTGIAAQNLKYNVEEVKEKVKEVEGDIVIQYYPTKSAGTLNLLAHMERCKLQGKKPDLVIVDYADLLKPNGKNLDVRLQLGNIYEDLRGIAGEYGIPIWTASQANRSALEDDVIEADKISESYNKIMIADFVVSLSRKIEDKANGTGRLHVIKNRFGPDGITLPSKANMSNGKFEIFTEASVQGKQAKAIMENGGETMRKILAQKMKEME